MSTALRGAMWALVVATACEGTSAPPRHAAPSDSRSGAPPRAGAGDSDAAESSPLPHLEQLTGGANAGEPLPLLVTLHGRGSRPESFTHFFEDLDVKLRVWHLRAPIDEGNGLAWWSFRGKGRAEITAIVRELGSRTVASLRAARTEHEVLGEPALLGFSQGAMIVYAVALDHPRAFARVYPVSGVLFDSLLPPRLEERVASLPVFRVFHGERDPIISMRSGVGSIAPLRQAGASIEVETFPDVPHWIMGSMKDAIHAELAELHPQPPRGRAMDVRESPRR